MKRSQNIKEYMMLVIISALKLVFARRERNPERVAALIHKDVDCSVELRTELNKIARMHHERHPEVQVELKEAERLTYGMVSDPPRIDDEELRLFVMGAPIQAHQGEARLSGARSGAAFKSRASKR